MRIADRTSSGKVHIIEQTVSEEANAPFGGVGASGTGSRFGGAAANIEAFPETQWLTMRPEIAPYPFWSRGVRDDGGMFRRRPVSARSLRPP